MPFRSCPHLGLRDDITTHMDYPSYDNFCYASGERRVISMADQARLCLSDRYMSCSRLAAERNAPTPWAEPRDEALRPAPQPRPTSPSEPLPTVQPKCCPYLGSLSNPQVHIQYPSYHNFCYASGKRRVVSMSDQGRMCLTAEYKSCDRPGVQPQQPSVEVPEKAIATPKVEIKPARKVPSIDLVKIANLAIQGRFSETITEAERLTEGLDSNAAKSLVWGLLVSSYSEATGDLASDFVFSCWKRALESDPTNFRSYYGLAFYYAGHGDYPNALWAASQVLKLAPKDDPTYKGIWQFIGMAEQKLGTEMVEKYLKRG